ncbi:MAG: alkaline phosphatase family protein [Ardenticatenaceae bacterium]|nr:alkaline phosphatase family protein [Ardenticatenaceae bacterium]
MFRRLFSRKKDPKLFVIGLDCAPPELLFDQWRHELPHLGRLMDRGILYEMMSCTPAITVPAWSVMTSSKDPGTLGFYGFRNRRDHSYDNRYIATSQAVKEKRVWQILDEAGKKSIILGVPQTYPIQPLKNGHVISSFLTPNTTSPRIQWTHPAALRQEIEELLAPEIYDVDVPQFRTDDKDFLLQQLHDMTRKRFKLLRYLMEKKPWEFFMFVEMGTDRINHALWGSHDPTHRKYDPEGPYVHAIRDYYLMLDREIGSLLERLPPEAHVMVVSDHGAKKMDGGICINEWLIGEGYLTLKETPPADRLTPLDKLSIDWSKTTVWGDGGYYARIWLNLAGRELQGAIPAEEYEAFRDRLAEHIKSIPGPDGRPLNTRVFKPEAIYQKVKNVAPDLLVYFDDLAWRSVGTLGHGDLYTFENDTGPDDANHAENGVLIYSPPANEASLGGQMLGQVGIMDFAPTVLSLLEVPIPDDMQGKVINFVDDRQETRE